MRLLVAEDEKRLNKIICEALEDEGYSVDACFDGEQALEYARAAEYDAMVMDIMMPRLDGLEAVRQMRSERICAPVLFLTARDSIADRVEGLESGGDYSRIPLQIRKPRNPTNSGVFLCISTLRGAFSSLNTLTPRCYFLQFVSTFSTKNAN